MLAILQAASLICVANCAPDAQGLQTYEIIELGKPSETVIVRKPRTETRSVLTPMRRVTGTNPPPRPKRPITIEREPK